MNNHEIALKFSGVSKAFGQVVALDDFDLTLQQGELVTLLGPSGCGKTTALRIAAGFERPNSGSVFVKDKDVTSLPAHTRNMGMVFQNYSLFPHMTVAENVGFGLRVRGVDAAERDMLVVEAVSRVRLAGLEGRYPHQLSGGQQQRVALARALVFQPEVLLLDEPLSALDAKVREELRDEIRTLQRDAGIGAIFVTHDQDEALNISDRVCVMKDGKIQQIGSPRDIYLRPVNGFVARFIGAMNVIDIQFSPQNKPLIAGVELDSSVTGPVGSVAQILVRPDAVSLCQRGTFGSIDGTVVGEHFSGATTILRIRLDRAEVTISAMLVSRNVQLNVGDGVGVVIDPNEVLLDSQN
ncbi:MAG: ABC transporter ATP-binding protein [Actinomycetota bacterium]|jgi:putative spermidine/putrescine transport system ATP-binding protein